MGGIPGQEQGILRAAGHELREAQRHAVLLSEQRASAKVGLFLQMLETHQAARGESK